MTMLLSKWHAEPPARVAVAVALLLATAACAATSNTSEAPEIMIEGLDYTYRIPDSIPSGPARIAFENEGDVVHELVFARLLPGVSVADMLEAYRTGARTRREIMDPSGGVLIADPGQALRPRLAVTLESGQTYVIYCTLHDGADEPAHLVLGMVRAFTVS